MLTLTMGVQHQLTDINIHQSYQRQTHIYALLTALFKDEDMQRQIIIIAKVCHHALSICLICCSQFSTARSGHYTTLPSTMGFHEMSEMYFKII